MRTIYITPTKALCRQQVNDWNDRFGSIGVKCMAMTGDDMQHRSREAKLSNVLFITPEKLDVITRKWNDNKDFFSEVGLVIMDEVHLLAEERRGATLEAVVLRLRFIKTQLSETTARFAAVSATAPNLVEIGRWLQVQSDQAILNFGPEFRPCPLEVNILGFGSENDQRNDFLFERELAKYVGEVLETYSNGKPAIVFCTSRKDAKDLAERLSTSYADPLNLNAVALKQREEGANKIKTEPLSLCIHRAGIAWHTAGVNVLDLELIEDLFRRGLLCVITCTTTLAQGVNLPAHLVVVKNTKAYRGSARGMENISFSTILQMVGRAGRFGFDIEGRAVIMTRKGEESRFVALLNGLEPIESKLQDNLREVLVNEIAVGVIQSYQDAYRWLETTFLFHQKGKQPSDKAKLKASVAMYLNEMRRADCINLTVERKLEPKELGQIVCSHYLRLGTALIFRANFQTASPNVKPNDDDTMNNILRTLASASEFSEFALRRDQKRWLNGVNWKLGRFTNKTNKNRVSNVAEKNFQLLQAILGRVPQPSDHVLRQEMATLAEEGARVTKALATFTTEICRNSCAVSAQLFLRCLQTKAWPDAGELFQLPHVGPKILAKLKINDIHSLDTLLEYAAIIPETLKIEIGKTRMPRIIEQAKEIVARRVQIMVNVQFDRRIIFLRGGSPKGTGFHVFVLERQTGRLLQSEYLRPEGAPMNVKVSPSTQIKVHAIHPKFHGIDAFFEDGTSHPPQIQPAKITAAVQPIKRRTATSKSTPVGKKQKQKQKQQPRQKNPTLPVPLTLNHTSTALDMPSSSTTAPQDLPSFHDAFLA